VAAENDAPVVAASLPVLAYVENQAATAIDAGFTLSDPDLPASLAGGWLEVGITANGVAGEDNLTVLNQGTGAGQIGVTGTTVTYGGVAIGSIDATRDGLAGQPLRVNLDAGASVAAAQALARAVAYGNSSDLPSTASRSVVFTLDDGGNSGSGSRLQASSAVITVTVASVNDAPLGTDGAVSLKQGTALALSATDFGFSDAVEGDAFAGVLVNSIPAGAPWSSRSARAPGRRWRPTTSSPPPTSPRATCASAPVARPRPRPSPSGSATTGARPTAALTRTLRTARWRSPSPRATRP
jgi:hypothetical protein